MSEDAPSLTSLLRDQQAALVQLTGAYQRAGRPDGHRDAVAWARSEAPALYGRFADAQHALTERLAAADPVAELAAIAERAVGSWRDGAELEQWAREQIDPRIAELALDRFGDPDVLEGLVKGFAFPDVAYVERVLAAGAPIDALARNAREHGTDAVCRRVSEEAVSRLEDGSGEGRAAARVALAELRRGRSLDGDLVDRVVELALTGAGGGEALRLCEDELVVALAAEQLIVLVEGVEDNLELAQATLRRAGELTIEQHRRVARACTHVAYREQAVLETDGLCEDPEVRAAVADPAQPALLIELLPYAEGEEIEALWNELSPGGRWRATKALVGQGSADPATVRGSSVVDVDAEVAAQLGEGRARRHALAWLERQPDEGLAVLGPSALRPLLEGGDGAIRQRALLLAARLGGPSPDPDPVERRGAR